MSDAPVVAAPSPIVEAIEAVEKTIADPSLSVLVEDVVMVYKLANEVKAKLQGKHPSLALIFNALFNVG